MSYADGPIPVPPDDTFLVDNVQGICICDSGALWFSVLIWFISIKALKVLSCE